MFYECWGNVGCLLIIKAVFMTSPKANTKGKAPSVFLSGLDERLTFHALGGLHGRQPWKIRLGSMFRKAKGFEVESQMGPAVTNGEVHTWPDVTDLLCTVPEFRRRQGRIPRTLPLHRAFYGCHSCFPKDPEKKPRGQWASCMCP